MDWDAFGALAEAVGAAAVLITLVYLAQQVRHARHEQQAAAIRAMRSDRRQFFEGIRDSPHIPAILCKADDGEPLTREEARRLLAHNAATCGLVYAEWVQARLALPGDYRTSFEGNITLLGSVPNSREWFDHFANRLYPEAFVSDVERIWREYDRSNNNEGGSRW
jgi:hypothetical protein